MDKRARAAAFLPEAEYWLGMMREVYKERLAQSFERLSPQTQAEVEKTGAKIAVMEDLLRDLRALKDDALLDPLRKKSED